MHKGTHIEKIPYLIFFFFFLNQQEKRIDVRQISIGVLGDLVVNAFERVRPTLPQFMPLLFDNLFADYVSVCNNTSWTIGEISVRWGNDFKPFIPTAMAKLMAILTRPNLNRRLKENIAITIGRFGLAHPQETALYLDKFLVDWCNVLRKMEDSEDKEAAIRGLYNLLKLQPNMLTQNFILIAMTVISFEQPTEALKNLYGPVFQSLKNSVTTQQWDHQLEKFPNLKILLTSKYGLM